MGTALLQGWLAAGIDPALLAVSEPEPSPELHHILTNQAIARDTSSMVVPPAAIVLAVKPQVIDTVMPSIARLCGPETVVISIAAGRTIASLASQLPERAAIVRAMPNTPAAIRRGITAAVANPHVSGHQAALSERLLSATGDFLWLEDEAQMDAVTAVSGSGPAYVFLLAECLAGAGIAAGLDARTAARLARQTVSGAGELLHRSDAPPESLREAVTSPGGTTAAALAVLMAEPGLTDLMTRAVAAAAQRSKELAR